MKYIQKQPQPPKLIKWTHSPKTDQDGRPMQWGYEDMNAEVRQIIKESLLQEQGRLCCYSGRRINSDASHIEHLKPQHLCVNHEDTDYANLLAAYPAANGGFRARYGAHAKDNWYDEHLFVHPLRPDCEHRFRFKSNGKVEATNLHDQGAVETIRRLNLTDRELTKMRESAIDTVMNSIGQSNAKKSKAEKLMTAMSGRNQNGDYYEFCFAIKQVLEKYLKRFD